MPVSMPDTEVARCALAAQLDVPQGLQLTTEENGLARLEQLSQDKSLYSSALSQMARLEYVMPLEKGETRHGYTWQGSNSVVKVPLNRVGITMSRLEVAYYEQDAYHGYPVVPCRLLWLESGLPIVLMEKVEILPFAFDVRKPQWSENIDNGQTAQSALLGGAWAVFDAGYPPLAQVADGGYDYVASYVDEFERIVGKWSL